ncbi:MAG: ABC transporter substrate-binding protein [Lachnospiraceae bacterium]|nr:ABC transporter substrate-binding protein [Lachnospiraceae bacterium]
MKGKEFFKRVLAMLMIMVIGAALAACGGKDSNDAAGGTNGTGKMKDTTIKIRVMNEYRNLDKVLKKYEEMTKDDPIMSKIHPEFTFVVGGDYKDKLTMAVAAQEDYDLMFCGGWHGLSNFVQEGDFADLTSYFNNDKFPGLKKAFSKDFTDAMTSYVRNDDGTYSKGIFGINLASYFEDSRGFMYREDLRKKYNCAPIKDEESLMAFVKTVVANEPDMEGVSISNFFRMDSPWYSAKHDHVYTQDNVNIFGDQTWAYVGLSADEKTVLNVVFPGDDAAEFAKMPEGYKYDFITEYIVDRTKWNDYLNPSRGTTDAVEKDAAITYCALTEYESKYKEAKGKNPDAEFGYYVIEDAQRNKEKGAVVCDMVTNNWLVVPEWSEKTDAVMYFLDWMFGSQEAHDLFQYGIQGEDWEAVGEDGYRLLDLDEDKQYFMPTYSFTLNPTYVRDSEFVMNNKELKADFEYIYDNATYKLSPLAGFTFNKSELETQVANISALSGELQFTLSMYDAKEAVAKINTWNADAKKVGLEKVRQEMINQIQAFLDVKNGK